MTNDLDDLVVTQVEPAIDDLNHGASSPKSFVSDYEDYDRVLGQGAVGIVRKAESVRTGIVCAVKVFRKCSLSDDDLERMRAEIRIHTGLSHPCIVPVHDVYESEDDVHLIMERLAGGEVFDRVAQRKQLAPELVAVVTVQLLRAVAYLHSRRILHRDITLQNIMYESQDGNNVKLIDLGHAVSLDDREALLNNCGTLGYIAPEILQEQPYDAVVDIWSVGICGFTMLTRKEPFSAATEATLHDKNKRGKVNYGPTFKKLPMQAQSFVRKLLTVDPKQRPNACSALSQPWVAQMVPEQVAAAQVELGQYGANSPPKAEYSSMPTLLRPTLPRWFRK